MNHRSAGERLEEILVGVQRQGHHADGVGPVADVGHRRHAGRGRAGQGQGRDERRERQPGAGPAAVHRAPGAAGSWHTGMPATSITLPSLISQPLAVLVRSMAYELTITSVSLYFIYSVDLWPALRTVVEAGVPSAAFGASAAWPATTTTPRSKATPPATTRADFRMVWFLLKSGVVTGCPSGRICSAGRGSRRRPGPPG